MGAQFRRVEQEINHPPSHSLAKSASESESDSNSRALGVNLCYGAITFQQKPRESSPAVRQLVSSRRGVIHLNYHTASKRKTLQIKQNVALMGLEIH